MEITAYQTIQNRHGQTVSEIENNGPILCLDEDAWLGDGYYFWDTEIELAHTWGKNRVNNNYVICESLLIHDIKCFDLVHNGNHRKLFRECTNTLESKERRELTVPEVIENLKRIGAFEDYDSIRVDGIHSFNKILKVSKKRRYRYFSQNYPGYMNLYPEIQICLIENDSMNREGYKVIYPQSKISNVGVF